MKVHDSNYTFLLDVIFLQKNPAFGQKILPRPNLCQNSHKMLHISGNTEPFHKQGFKLKYIIILALFLM